MLLTPAETFYKFDSAAFTMASPTSVSDLSMILEVESNTLFSIMENLSSRVEVVAAPTIGIIEAKPYECGNGNGGHSGLLL